MITYKTSLEGITANKLEGFCARWKTPLSRKQLFTVLKNSSYFVLAFDTDTDRVIGFVNALSDGIQFAFIPMLEVLPDYRKKGIGSNLMEKKLDLLDKFDCIDLTCDPSMQSFYKRFSMLESHGMVLRKFLDR